MSTRKAAEISASSSSSNDENEHTPVAKKLKCSSTDLIIRLGQEKYEFHCHAVLMANHSDFIDATLASPMRESQTRIIDLPDISPRIWGLMMEILDSPPTMTPIAKNMDDLILAAEKFDQYQFVNGFAVCGTHVALAFQAFSKMFVAEPLRVGQRMTRFIEYALKCDKIQLKLSNTAITSFFRRAINLPQERGNHYGGLIFSKEQLQKLAPLIAEENLLGDQWTKEEILCPLFPKYYLAATLKEYEEKRFGPLHKHKPMKLAILRLVQSSSKKYNVAALQKTTALPVTTPSFAGTPQQNDGAVWSEELQNSRLVLRKTMQGNWVIAVSRNQNNEGNRNNWRILWISPMSINCVNVPPMKPWCRVDDGAPTGTLSIFMGSQGSGPLPAAMGGRAVNGTNGGDDAAADAPAANNGNDNNNNGANGNGNAGAGNVRPGPPPLELQHPIN
ncbi:unnamed protein product [Cylindrotheca closterium]|uniref:BTB domain-containing protein n=1 Tax=Cylindrotheca closterium TaxID=2856 RepID=A0AAD2PX65_9STRA|nr:unnamed protein product [Cylindrotheca closterium]